MDSVMSLLVLKRIESVANLFFYSVPKVFETKYGIVPLVAIVAGKERGKVSGSKGWKRS